MLTPAAPADRLRLDGWEGCPIATVSVGARQVRLLIDTGSDETYLNADLLPWKPDSEEVAREERVRIGRSTFSARVVYASTPGLRAMATERSGRVDGILGLNVLRRFTVGLDLRRKELALWPASTRAGTALDGWLPSSRAYGRRRRGDGSLSTDRNGLIEAGVVVQGVPLRAVIDTGASGSGIEYDAVERLGALRLTHSVEVHVFRDTPTLAYTFQPTLFALLGLRLEPPPRTALLEWDGLGQQFIVGRDVLAQTRAVFDFKRGRLALETYEPQPSEPEVQAQNWSRGDAPPQGGAVMIAGSMVLPLLPGSVVLVREGMTVPTFLMGRGSEFKHELTPEGHKRFSIVAKEPGKASPASPMGAGL